MGAETRVCGVYNLRHCGVVCHLEGLRRVGTAYSTCYGVEGAGVEGVILHCHLAGVAVDVKIGEVGSHNAHLTIGACERDALGCGRAHGNVLRCEVGIGRLVVECLALEGNILERCAYVVAEAELTLRLDCGVVGRTIIHEVGEDNEVVVAVGHKAQVEGYGCVLIYDGHLAILDGAIVVTIVATGVHIVDLQGVAKIYIAPVYAVVARRATLQVVDSAVGTVAARLGCSVASTS